MLLARFSPRVGFVMFFVMAALNSQAQTYASGFSDAKWSVTSGAFACALTHNIPAFGTAHLGQNAGGASFLEFRNVKKNFPAGAVRVEAIPPVWRNDIIPQALFSVAGTPLRLTSEQVKGVAASLETGINVVFSGSGGTMRVIVDGRGFAASYKSYQRCTANLIPYTFDQLTRTVIYYAGDAQSLSPAAKAQLDKIVRYIKADPKVLGILVDAHSDKREDATQAKEITRQQAEWVTGYLVDKGLSAATITTRWHGDSFPIADNKNKNGQAKNRRITLRLESAATRKETERRVAALKAAEEKAAAEQAAKVAAEIEKQIAADMLGVTAKQLEELVEKQDLTSGKQPGR